MKCVVAYYKIRVKGNVRSIALMSLWCVHNFRTPKVGDLVAPISGTMS